MKSLYPLLFVLMVSVSTFAQEKKDTLTIPEQFDKIYRTSSSYQEYKVIRKTRYQELKKGVSDSLNVLKSNVKAKDQLIRQQKDSIQDIKKVADILGMDLKQTIAQKNSINFLGIEFSKSTYNIIVWSLIGILLIALLYFVYQFKNSFTVTSQAKRDLEDVEQEFANHKKKSLEREQKLRRQLQDEINKQRGV